MSIVDAKRNSGLECLVKKGRQGNGHGVKRDRIVLCPNNMSWWDVELLKTRPLQWSGGGRRG